MVEIMIVVILIGVLSALVLPSVLNARRTSQRSLCIENLWELVSAQERWALEANVASGAAITDATVLDVYIKRGVAGVICPADAAQTFATSYQMNTVDSNPICRIVPLEHIL